MKKDFDGINCNNSTHDCPSDLVAEFLRFETDGGSLQEFLAQFDFSSRQDLQRAIVTLFYAIAGDKYLGNKYTQETDVHALCVFKRYSEICKKADKFDKYPASISGEMWHGSYSRERLNERTDAMFAGVPDYDKFAHAWHRLSVVYGLSQEDLQKLHFFVEQVKAGERFPNSLRRMLYLWGKEKQTGKTTSASVIAAILNGDQDRELRNRSKYETTLANEMQIGGVSSFKVPKISDYNVCMMDECFYQDMGKTYADFKRFLTSSNGRARLPFGQEFEWTGCPNYVTTSNDSLRKFIKDWGDRRYLSIEFKQKPTVDMSIPEVYEMWREFITNSTRPDGLEWKEWADRIAPISNEIGERQEIANEFELEMRHKTFLTTVAGLYSPNRSPVNPQNKISLKFFKDYFRSTTGADGIKGRSDEIKAAAVAVFGSTYSTTSYWLAYELKERANILLGQINMDGDGHEEDEADAILPF